MQVRAEKTLTEIEGLGPATSSDTILNVEWADRRTAVVTPEGEFDLRCATDLRRELFGAVADGADTVVVDMATTTFIDSMTLGILLGAARRLQQRGGELRIACVDPNIRRIFEITLLDRVFAIYPSLHEALGRSATAT
jgi:anti-sigma B factor antagonist